MTATLMVAAAEVEAEAEAAVNLQTEVDEVDAAVPPARKALMTHALETLSSSPTPAKASSRGIGKIAQRCLGSIREPEESMALDT